jgi:transposase
MTAQGSTGKPTLKERPLSSEPATPCPVGRPRHLRKMVRIDARTPAATVRDLAAEDGVDAGQHQREPVSLCQSPIDPQPAVVSSLKTVSARAILSAMIEGERDPRVLAQMAKGRLRRKLPELTEALIGAFDEHHARLARSILHRLQLVESAMLELDEVIAAACLPWEHEIQLLETIPGVGEKVAQVFIAETGGDMSRFPSAAHLAAWAGLAPAIYESAGRRTPAGARHGNKWLNHMLVESAGSVARMHGKNYLSVQHARLTKRRGLRRAQVAVAHSILVSAYWMLTRDEPYRDLGPDWHVRRNTEAHTRRLVTQLERLGHTVALDQPPAA